jgi:hypothetical protein
MIIQSVKSYVVTQAEKERIGFFLNIVDWKVYSPIDK